MRKASNHSKGYYRDLKVLDHLERCTCLNTDQIHLLEFTGITIDMVHRCCRRLERKHRIRRGERLSFSEKDWFYLYDAKKPGNIEHTLGKSWVYVFLVLNARASGYRGFTFENEPIEFLPAVKPDQFVTFDTSSTSKKIYFNEFTRQSSGNPFTKIKQYNALAEKLISDRGAGIATYWWADTHKNVTFTVLIVTDGEQAALDKLSKIIKRDKRFPYSVELLSLKAVKQFCYKLHLIKKEELQCSQELKLVSQSSQY